jgi:hypothetical protein
MSWSVFGQGGSALERALKQAPGGSDLVKRPVPDSDDIVRVRPTLVPDQPQPRQPSVWSRIAVGVAVGAGVGGAAVGFSWLVWPGFHPASVAPVAEQAPVPAPPPSPPLVESAPSIAIETAAVAQNRSHQPVGISFLRLVEAPRILVLDFASLKQQAHMLDRVAALVERANQPKDRILTAEELDRAVRADGDADAGFYYGHDYSAASLIRFFGIADFEGVVLSPEEDTLRRLLQRLGWLEPGTVAAVISLPRVGSDDKVTASARDAILMHELSHGAYFSDPVYAAYVHQFFTTGLTAAEQAAFRSYLAREGYDSGNPGLVENETVAYLLFTTDAQFFPCRRLG